MKLGRMTKCDKKKNKKSSKEINDEAMLTNCHVIAFFPIYGQPRAVRKPDSANIV